jgi:hypothetical protein
MVLVVFLLVLVVGVCRATTTTTAGGGGGFGRFVNVRLCRRRIPSTRCCRLRYRFAGQPTYVRHVDVFTAIVDCEYSTNDGDRTGNGTETRRIFVVTLVGQQSTTRSARRRRCRTTVHRNNRLILCTSSSTATRRNHALRNRSVVLPATVIAIALLQRGSNGTQPELHGTHTQLCSGHTGPGSIFTVNRSIRQAVGNCCLVSCV